MTESEIEVMKRSIEVQLDEYEAAIKAASDWYAEWQKRQQNRGFRCMTRKREG